MLNQRLINFSQSDILGIFKSSLLRTKREMSHSLIIVFDYKIFLER